MEENENPNNTEEIKDDNNIDEEKKEVIEEVKEESTEEISENIDIKRESKKNSTKNSKRIRIIIVFTILLIYALYTAITVRAEHLNYIGINPAYETVFNEKIHSYYSILGILFVCFNIIFYLTNKFIFSGLKKFFDEEKKEMPKLPNKTLCIIGSLFFSILFTKILKDKFLICKNAAVFGKGDPIFNIDISYYMFILPFIHTLLISIGAFILFLAIYVGLYYVIVFNVYFDEGIDVEKLKKNTFVKQEVFFVILLVVTLCIYIFVNAQNIFTENMLTISDEKSTALIGAGMTDTTIKVWGYRLLCIVVVLAVIRLLRFIKKSDFKQSIISVAIVPAYLVCMFIVMIAFQMIYVGKNELDGEQTYIKHNIENTKEAYNIEIEQENIKEYD